MKQRFENMNSAEGAQRRKAEEARDRILNVAERLFASRGFAGVSVRDITAEADVNLAAVNYYFGSKAGLLKAVFLRRATALNRERMAELQAVVDAHPSGALPLPAVLRALLGPPVRWQFDPDRGLGVFIQFLARCQMEEEPELRALFYEDVEHLRRFIPALKRALPEMPEDEICWGLHFALGAMHHTFTHLPRLGPISQGRCHIGNRDEVIERMVEFATGGFEAARARITASAR
ncbi:MAG: TetR/AcrR family transcriptional regulator [Alphaproteobacteria bacterium]|nr:MAG: TetR/AcrR family transcriptional regulator [Alphaproteobacteria bacterium]